MSFASFGFAVLLAVVILARVTIGRTKQSPFYLGVLLGASLLFYGWHIPAYALLLIASITVDYVAGLGMGRPEASPRWRRALLILSLATNLGLLALFKYADFFLEWTRALGHFAGFDTGFESLGWALPMGISFYTFQSMSYTIDVYRRVLPPYRSFWKFALFVSFFPQLVAGPIVRAKEFLYQIDRRRSLRMPAIREGLFLLIEGFFLKVVVSNHLGTVGDAHWDEAAAPGASSLAVLIVAFLFGIQIFADFAGYSNIARGCGYLLGFRIPVNFESPYIATSFREYWARWHMTLSQWLRDYLYISLGGNRRGARRTLVNLWLVMALAGLWHGAATHFVVWGALHGAALVVERLLGFDGRSGRSGALREFGWFCVAQGGVLLGWLVFRATDLDQTGAFLANLASLRFVAPETLPIGWALIVASPVLLMHLRAFAVERLGFPPAGTTERALLAGAMLYLCLTANGVSDAFIYFQF